MLNVRKYGMSLLSFQKSRYALIRWTSMKKAYRLAIVIFHLLMTTTTGLSPYPLFHLNIH